MATGEGQLAAQQAKISAWRHTLGEYLATYRRVAGLSQPDLAQALGKTRSMVSKVEHGTRSMTADLWATADQVCGADGALISEHARLVQAEQDYRHQCRTHRRQARQAAAQTRLEVLKAAPVRPDRLVGDDGWPGVALDDLVSRQLAKELMTVIDKLAKAVGRRQAMHLASWALATLALPGLEGLDTERYQRVAHAVANPGRVDAQVITHLSATLASGKRLEDRLGPAEVLDTALAQHAIVRRLLEGGCPDRLRRALQLLDANMAVTIGGYLLDLGHPDTACGYFTHARKTAHQAANPSYAAYAAAWISSAAFLRGDIPTALDSAAAARSLAARTPDPQLKAAAEQMAAAAYALDGQYNPCMTAYHRAHEYLAHLNGRAVPDSPAYWIHHGAIDSQHSTYLCLLNKPAQAVHAATNAQTRFEPHFVIGYAHCQIRLAHALVLDKDINHATHTLSQAAGMAHLLPPRLTDKLRTTRTLMQPWANTHPVQELDDQLHASGLMIAPPNRKS